MSGEQGSFTKDRKFPNLQDWGEFIERWGAARSEEEAIGLLYAGTSVRVNITEQTQEAARQRVEFYLHWAGYWDKNPLIASTAQRIIVTKLLSSRVLASSRETADSHQALLRFLREPKLALKRSPYPRFVSNYVLSVFHHWLEPGHENRGFYGALQDMTEDVVYPVISWGHGWVLERSGVRREVVSIIEKFLKEKKFDVARVLSSDRSFELLEDLTRGRTDEIICERAAGALLELRYRYFGGVSIMPQSDGTAALKSPELQVE